MPITKKGDNNMTKEKKHYWEKFNPLELWMWQNKNHFGALVKTTTYAGPYGCRRSKWRYDLETGEFVWNQFNQIEKHKWSKEAIIKRMSAEKLLKGLFNDQSPIWNDFKKALEKYKKEKEAS